MTMNTTTDTLQRIRGFLRQDPPDTARALRLVKDALIRTPCSRELDVSRNNAERIIAELVRPALATDREKQALADRLARQYRTERVLDEKTAAPALREMKPWLAALAGQVPAPETEPPFPPDHLLAALAVLTGEPVKTTGREKNDWPSMQSVLGRMLNREQRQRQAWERERRQLLELLTLATTSLARAIRLTGRGEDGKELEMLGKRMADGEPVADVAALKESLLLEAEGFRARMDDVEKRLRESAGGVKKFQELLRRADWAVQETRDDTLVDVFTGLPNRFALSARIERAFHPLSGRRRPFCLAAIRLDEFDLMIRELGRDRVNRLMAALAARLAAEPGEGDYLARYDEGTFMLLCPESGPEAVRDLCRRLRDILDRTRFELEDAALVVRTAYGIVQAQADMTEEGLLDLALQSAETALTGERERIHIFQSREGSEIPEG